jgi:hypothetical protein
VLLEECICFYCDSLKTFIFARSREKERQKSTRVILSEHGLGLNGGWARTL